MRKKEEILEPALPARRLRCDRMMIYTCFHAILFLNIKVYGPKFTERNKARNAHIPYDQAGIFLL